MARHDILHTALCLAKDGDSAYQVVLDVSVAVCGVVEVGTEQEALDASIEKTKRVKASLSGTSLTPPLWLNLFITETKQVYVHLLMGHMLIDHVSLAHVLYDWDMLYRGLSPLGDPDRIPQFAAYAYDVESRDSLASTNFWAQKLRGAAPTILQSSYELTRADAGPVLAEGPSMINFKIGIDASMHNTAKPRESRFPRCSNSPGGCCSEYTPAKSLCASGILFRTGISISKTPMR